MNEIAREREETPVKAIGKAMIRLSYFTPSGLKHPVNHLAKAALPRDGDAGDGGEPRTTFLSNTRENP
ncbi:hypothetical protein [Rhizobium ruizarguesonis]|uniref:hypothetical protein n=1 Tax=Rhizobium ruizarguesonis TaxID=2081791 RepID=UPI0013CC85F5|nr:hypothetical protein [Rhizobium ruizarguesonis]NEH28777.1 hypothetical protein [Rhizobium ruizarguesonis]NEI77506.1 hypothetical protein [Rhizobium ruizarguesonis]